MKKMLVLLFVICLMLAGCQKGTQKQDISPRKESITPKVQRNTDQKEDVNKTEDNLDHLKTELFALNKEWSVVTSLKLNQTSYEAPSYEANVPAYKIAKNLSNIENIKQFKGFNEQQLAMLSENGFVVVPSTDTRTYYVYDDNEYKGIPNFITSDSILHLFHQLYDKSLASIETDYLYQELDQLSQQMLYQSILLSKKLKDPELIALQKKNIIYFLTARMLFTQTTDNFVNIDKEQIDIARQEYELCKAARGYEVSPLFEEDLDYSQFLVRGHYTRSDELSRFFKTMMWFGTAPLALVDKKGNLIEDNLLQALLITFAAFSDSDQECNAKLWSDIYQPTSQYVGLSDDTNIFDINKLRLSVYGNMEDPNILKDASYLDKLKEAVKLLPEPRIRAEFLRVTTPTGKQFRFMGQRYTLDSEILQELIDSNKRPIPSSLDVMGVLGSETAKKLLFEEYQPQKTWQNYTERFAKLEAKVSDFHMDDWKSNLYTGWLWSIKEDLTEYQKGSNMPSFMTSEAWKYKALNTALGSYTELKHDSVLYGKQAAAEMGGPEAFADQQYVEPDINLYRKLLYLTELTTNLLNEKGMLKEELKQGSSEYKEYLNLLINCSIKELNNEVLTKEEKKELLWSGGKMERIMNQFILGATGDISNIDVTDMLITDISTCQETYLSLGTGYFDHIYVVIPYGGKLYLSRGAVYSCYEFVSEERLTDEEWWAMQGIKIQHTDYGDYPEFGDRSDKLPAQPSWVKYFKTEKNTVTVQPLEVDWEKLSE